MDKFCNLKRRYYQWLIQFNLIFLAIRFLLSTMEMIAKRAIFRNSNDDGKVSKGYEKSSYKHASVN